jgi:hypothetical protein
VGDPETTHIEIVEEVCTVAEHERLRSALEESERRVEELATTLRDLWNVDMVDKPGMLDRVVAALSEEDAE